jgi:4-amino-4-deoxy-L-arabinose transferase-like glycosyltransferase
MAGERKSMIPPAIRTSDFVILSSFVLRHSTFRAFPILHVLPPPTGLAAISTMFYHVAVIAGIESASGSRRRSPEHPNEARMRSLFEHRWGHYLILTAASLPLFFWNLGSATLWDLDEGRNLTCAYEMMLSDNWVVPTYNNALRLHKPVLQYWLQILCYLAGGVNETMGRLPSAFSALLTLFVVYELGRRMFSKSTGLLAGLVTATCPTLIGAARFANPDALLNLFNALTMLVFWINFQRPTVRGYLLFGASAGLAVLAKGPVGIVLPGAIIVAYAVWDGRWRMLFDARVGWAVLSFILVAAPWYILVGVLTKAQFLKGFLGTHNVNRFLTPMENHRGSVLYYPFVIFAGTMPWSFFAGGTIWAAFWSCIRKPSIRWQGSWDRAADPTGRGGVSAYRFLAAWFIVYIGFFTLSATKLPNYILPVIVPWTILTARFLDRWRKGTLALPSWFLAAAISGLVLLGVGIGVGAAIASGVGEFAFMRNRFFPTLLPAAWVGIIPIAGAGALAWLARRGRPLQFVGVWLATAVVLFTPIAAWATLALNGSKAPANIGRTIVGRTDLDIRVVALDMGHLPSLCFYLRRDVEYTASVKDVLNAMNLPLPTFLLIPEKWAGEFQTDHPGLATELSRHADLYHGGHVVVLANGPAAALANRERLANSSDE